MVLNPTNNSSTRTVIMHSLFTCISLSLLVLVLHYTDNLYHIGKYHCMPWIAALVCADCVKFGLSLFITDTGFGSRDTKLVKVKKYYSKLKLKEIFKCIYVLIGSTGIVYVFAVLFGAPVFSECEETLMFSILVSALCVFPACLNVGADNTVTLLTGIKLASNTVMGDMMLKNIQLTLIGAWLAAVVIPLDWDRPWQAWPIPSCIGAILGCILAQILTVIKSLPVPNILKSFTIR